ncbi:MAG: class II aldolase/adducin family protein, partial [Rhodoblastus sp.]
AIHYMIAHFGGPDIRCSPYALYGSAELSAHVLKAMEGRNGCLLSNHGMIAAGRNLAQAMWLAVELETLARQYWHVLQVGGPVLLSDEEVRQAAEKFGVSGYGLAG